MNGKTVRHQMHGAFVFVLLGVFALMSTLLVLLGAQMYKGIEEHNEANNKTRILTSYVRSMIRAEDAYRSVNIEEYDGITTLALHEIIGEVPYVTWIYSFDGMLCEQFTKEERPFTPGMGNRLTEVREFVPFLDRGIVTIRMDYGEDEFCVVTTALHCAPQETGMAADAAGMSVQAENAPERS